MKGSFVIAVAAVLAGPVPALGEDASNNDDTLILVNNIRQKDAEVFIKNVGTQRFKSLYLECILRDSSGGRIDSVPVYVRNLDPGDSTTEEARTHKTRGIASVDCRIESIHRD